ncbi:MAG TPA: hypothetical protein VH595_20085 [Verrucomicrobiae bacterium]|nr:hypothetical protein [Verrucomicrobiae bacterium]
MRTFLTVMPVPELGVNKVTPLVFEQTLKMKSRSSLAIAVLVGTTLVGCGRSNSTSTAQAEVASPTTTKTHEESSKEEQHWEMMFTNTTTAIPQDLRKSWNILISPATRQG